MSVEIDFKQEVGLDTRPWDQRCEARQQRERLERDRARAVVSRSAKVPGPLKATRVAGPKDRRPVMVANPGAWNLPDAHPAQENVSEPSPLTNTSGMLHPGGSETRRGRSRSRAFHTALAALIRSISVGRRGRYVGARISRAVRISSAFIFRVTCSRRSGGTFAAAETQPGEPGTTLLCRDDLQRGLKERTMAAVEPVSGESRLRPLCYETGASFGSRTLASPS